MRWSSAAAASRCVPPKRGLRIGGRNRGTLPQKAFWSAHVSVSLDSAPPGGAGPGGGTWLELGRYGWGGRERSREWGFGGAPRGRTASLTSGLSIGRGVASLAFMMMMCVRRSFLVWVGRSGRGGRAVARVPGEFHSTFRGQWSCAVRRVRVANGPRAEGGARGLKTGFALSDLQAKLCHTHV